MKQIKLKPVTETIGIDVGGTKISAAVVAADGSISRLVKSPTPKTSADDLQQQILRLLTEINAPEIDTIGVAAAGLVSTSGVIVYSAHLPWQHQPLQAKLAAITGKKVRVFNDATAAVAGEAKYGAVGAVQNILLITLGTGLGAGIICNGSLLLGANGFAAEFGHIPVLGDRIKCTCGLVDCWEIYASGSALNRYAAGFGSELSGPALTAAAAAGDELALRAFDELGQWVGRGLGTAANILDPELIIIGGGVVAAWKHFAPAMEKQLAEQRYGFHSRTDLPSVIPAKLGNQAGLIGAARLARGDFRNKIG